MTQQEIQETCFWHQPSSEDHSPNDHLVQISGNSGKTAQKIRFYMVLYVSHMISYGFIWFCFVFMWFYIVFLSHFHYKYYCNNYYWKYCYYYNHYYYNYFGGGSSFFECSVFIWIFTFSRIIHVWPEIPTTTDFSNVSSFFNFNVFLGYWRLAGNSNYHPCFRMSCLFSI